MVGKKTCLLAKLFHPFLQAKCFISDIELLVLKFSKDVQILNSFGSGNCLPNLLPKLVKLDGLNMGVIGQG